MKNLKTGIKWLIEAVFTLGLISVISLLVIGETSTAVRLKFSSIPSSVPVGTPSETIAIVAVDASGSVVGIFNDTVTISTSSPLGKFSLNMRDWSFINKKEVPLLNGVGNVYYKDAALGFHKISVSTKGLIGDTQTISVVQK